MGFHSQTAPTGPILYVIEASVKYLLMKGGIRVKNFHHQRILGIYEGEETFLAGADYYYFGSLEPSDCFLPRVPPLRLLSTPCFNKLRSIVSCRVESFFKGSRKTLQNTVDSSIGIRYITRYECHAFTNHNPPPFKTL